MQDISLRRPRAVGSNGKPSRSCLRLEDWETKPLTVADLRDHKLQANLPFLAYLSACSTGVNFVHRSWRTKESIWSVPCSSQASGMLLEHYGKYQIGTALI